MNWRAKLSLNAASYASLLTWDRMAPLVLECEETFPRLREELERFLKDLEAQKR
jgi:hypothetical protein